jgi:phosphoribosylformimino-5-aminoimidazole carboxamide ribonucleotide (ProFAR) isomerase
VLVTDVGREGRMVGIDATLFSELAAATRHPLTASGGVGGARDLEALAAAGTAGVVLGMALYTGALDARAVAREYNG